MYTIQRSSYFLRVLLVFYYVRACRSDSTLPDEKHKQYLNMVVTIFIANADMMMNHTMAAFFRGGKSLGISSFLETDEPGIWWFH